VDEELAAAVEAVERARGTFDLVDPGDDMAVDAAIYRLKAAETELRVVLGAVRRAHGVRGAA